MVNAVATRTIQKSLEIWNWKRSHFTGNKLYIGGHHCMIVYKNYNLLEIVILAMLVFIVS